jgi:hypothetical protein
MDRNMYGSQIAPQLPRTYKVLYESDAWQFRFSGSVPGGQNVTSVSLFLSSQLSCIPGVVEVLDIRE